MHLTMSPVDGLGHSAVGANMPHQVAAEVAHRGEDAPIDHIALILGKPDFHLVQPGRVSRSEVGFYLRVIF